MVEMSAEQFAQRAFDLGLFDARQLESIWSELGTSQVSTDELRSLLMRRELMTNFQVERMLNGKRKGYFYGKYKVLYLVGAGTFARVYRAVHADTQQVVAVKVLRQRYSDDLIKTEHFMREARTVTSLRHPNIVPVYDAKSEGAVHYMIMDFVEGRNLRDTIKVRKQLDLDEALRIIIDIVGGLEYALGKGITHRDMKLSNVLLSSLGQARLVDFGLASVDEKINEAAAKDIPNARSIDYAALERASGVKKDDPRSDIYFVGGMLYHMLSGHSALRETRDRIQRLSISRFHEIVPITDRMPDLPPRISIIVNKSLELNPDKRYATPSEMLTDLRQAMSRLKSGDIEAPEEHAETVTTKASPSDASKIVPLEGQSRTVMLVETNVTIQDVLRERLKRLGYRVLVISNPERALSRFDDDHNVADCVVFSAASLGDAGFEAFNQFAEGAWTKGLPAILLVDEKQKNLVEEASLADHRPTLTMPLKFTALRDTLRKLLAREPAES